ncbi:nucleolar protein 15 [Geosmithia morbida]|uniref:Nucleolar protein 15 n=1 Tax=Geosmithia morbida TaxID=1094350 RepID=A0A9P4YP20_9HYPO|nr:nucleolar protein 15 [Geosmithia morbida]KAF4119425.1 nucleolar protein 15 [Geosmithia morbida]
MARELRSRKVPSDPKIGEVKASPVRRADKRKATSENESSPIPKKLQKGAGKAVVKKDAKATEKAVEKEDKVEDKEEDEKDRAEAGSESESGQEEEAEALAAELDPEEEEDAPDDAAVYRTGQPVGTIPDVSQAVEKAARSSGAAGGKKGEPGVIYIGRIPHGFYEHEMRQYFSQFGPISRLRLSRNKKTGASKHFAFIEFAEATTADIVAKTMNNYLLFGHILKCRTIPAEQVHDDLFKGANRRFKKVPWNKIAGRQLEKPLSEAAWEKKVVREQTKRSKKVDKLKAMGYEFDAPAIKDVPAPAPAPAPTPPAPVEAGEDDATSKAAIEDAPPADKKQKQDERGEAEVAEVAEKPEAESISAPKTKTKGTRATRSRKAKA